MNYQRTHISSNPSLNYLQICQQPARLPFVRHVALGLLSSSPPIHTSAPATNSLLQAPRQFNLPLLPLAANYCFCLQPSAAVDAVLRSCVSVFFRPTGPASKWKPTEPEYLGSFSELPPRLFGLHGPVYYYSI